jgi:hypothetical protein
MSLHRPRLRQHRSAPVRPAVLLVAALLAGGATMSTSGCAPMAVRAERAIDAGDLDRAQALSEAQDGEPDQDLNWVRLRLAQLRGDHEQVLALAEALGVLGDERDLQRARWALDSAFTLRRPDAFFRWWAPAGAPAPPTDPEFLAGLLDHVTRHAESDLAALTGVAAQTDDPASLTVLSSFVELTVYRYLYLNREDDAARLLDSVDGRLTPPFITRKLQAAIALQGRDPAGPELLNDAYGGDAELLEAIAFDYGARGAQRAAAAAWQELALRLGRGAAASYAWRNAAEALWRDNRPDEALQAARSAVETADQPALVAADALRLLRTFRQTNAIPEVLDWLQPPVECTSAQATEWIMLENAVAMAWLEFFPGTAVSTMQARFERLAAACAFDDVTDAAALSLIGMQAGDPALQFLLPSFNPETAPASRISLLISAAERAGATERITPLVADWLQARRTRRDVAAGDVLQALDVALAAPLVDLRTQYLTWVTTQDAPPLAVALRRATELEDAGQSDARRELFERVILVSMNPLETRLEFAEWMAQRNIDPVERLDFMLPIADSPEAALHPETRGPGRTIQARALWLSILAAHDARRIDQLLDLMLRWAQANGESDPDTWQTLWTQRRAVGLLDPAQRATLAQRSIDGGHDTVEMYRELAEALLVLGRTDEASAAYEHAVEVAPDTALRLVEDLADMRRPDIAVRVMERYRQVRGDSVSTRSRLADLYLALATQAVGVDERNSFRWMARQNLVPLLDAPGAWSTISPEALYNADMVDLAVAFGQRSALVSDDASLGFALTLATWMAEIGAPEPEVRAFAERGFEAAGSSARTRSVRAFERNGYVELAADLDETALRRELETEFNLNRVARTLTAVATTGDVERTRSAIQRWTIELANALLMDSPTVPAAVRTAARPNATAARLLQLGASRLCDLGDFDQAVGVAEQGLGLQTGESLGLMMIALRARAGAVTHTLRIEDVDRLVTLSDDGAEAWRVAAQQLGQDGEYELAHYAMSRHLDLTEDLMQGLLDLAVIAASAGQPEWFEEPWSEWATSAGVDRQLVVVRGTSLPLQSAGFYDLRHRMILSLEPWLASSTEAVELITRELIRTNQHQRAIELLTRAGALDKVQPPDLASLGLLDTALTTFTQSRGTANAFDAAGWGEQLLDRAVVWQGADLWDSAFRNPGRATGDPLAAWVQERWLARRGLLNELLTRWGAGTNGLTEDVPQSMAMVAMQTGQHELAVDALVDLANGRFAQASGVVSLEPFRLVATTLAAGDTQTLRDLAARLDAPSLEVRREILLAWADLLDGNLLDLRHRMHESILPQARAELRFDLSIHPDDRVGEEVRHLLTSAHASGFGHEALDWAQELAAVQPGVDTWDVFAVTLMVELDPEAGAALADRLVTETGDDPLLAMIMARALASAPQSVLARRPWLRQAAVHDPFEVQTLLDRARWTAPDLAESQLLHDPERTWMLRPSMQRERTDLLLARGDWEAANQALLDPMPSDPTAWPGARSVEELAHAGQQQAAIAALERLVVRNPNRRDELLRLLRTTPRALFPEIGDQVEQALARYDANGWRTATAAVRVSAALQFPDRVERLTTALQQVQERPDGRRLEELLQVLDEQQDRAWMTAPLLAFLDSVDPTAPVLGHAGRLVLARILASDAPDRARELLSPVLQDADRSLDVTWNLAEALLILEPERVTELAQDVLSAYPAATPPHQWLALLAVQQGDRDSALRHATAIIQDGASALRLLPAILERTAQAGWESEAATIASALSRVMTPEINDAIGWMQEGAWTALQQYRRANPALGLAFVDSTMASTTRRLEWSPLAGVIAGLHTANGEVDRAVDASLTDSWPNNATRLNNAAWILADGGGDPTVAADLARQSLARESADANTVDTLAWALFRQGRLAEADALSRASVLTALRDERYSLQEVAALYAHWMTIQQATPVPSDEAPRGRRRGRRER